MANVGSVNGEMIFIEATPSVDTSAYASGDLLCEKIEFSNLFSSEGQKDNCGLIQSVVVSDLAKQSVNLDVVFFDSDPSNTTFTENAALDIDDADILNVSGIAFVDEWYAFSDNSVGQAHNLAIPFVAGSNSLFVALVTRGAPTYAASDLTVRIGILKA